ncbi:MAG: hypothetical protein ACE5KE_08750 [Methanosarcinales archaeon]
MLPYIKLSIITALIFLFIFLFKNLKDILHIHVDTIIRIFLFSQAMITGMSLIYFAWSGEPYPDQSIIVFKYSIAIGGIALVWYGLTSYLKLFKSK